MSRHPVSHEVESVTLDVLADRDLLQGSPSEERLARYDLSPHGSSGAHGAQEVLPAKAHQEGRTQLVVS